MEEKHLYRYSDSISGDDIVLNTYKIIKETDKTYIISHVDFNFIEQRIRKNSRKKFAHDNKVDALKSYFFRKRKQVHLLKNKLNDAEFFKRRSNEMLNELGISVEWNQPIRYIYFDNY